MNNLNLGRKKQNELNLFNIIYYGTKKNRKKNEEFKKLIY